MNGFTYALEDGKFLNRFISTGVFAKDVAFKKAVLQGKVNEWLQKGFAIHENPCRKEFVNERQKVLPAYIDLSQHQLHEKINVFGVDRPLEIYYPFGNIGVEFSEFYFNPAFLQSYSYNYIHADKPFVANFSVETCGRVTIWVNDTLVTDFMPFTRNMVKSHEFSVELVAGLNKLVVCLEDLAERDTDFYFRIAYVGTENMEMYLPVSDDIDIMKINEIERILCDIHFDKEVYLSEDVILRIGNTLDDILDVDLRYKPVADKMTNAHKLLQTKKYQLKPAETEIVLFSSDEVVAGFYYFEVQVICQTGVLARKIATQVFHKDLLQKKEYTIAERKKEALAYLCDAEVDNVYKAAALFALDRDTVNAEKIILEELAGIRARKDCSDFHLVIVIQIYIFFREKLTTNLISEIKDTMLHFRYWIDEPGDDVMWFFSENHALLFHICQYFAGDLFPQEVFSNSGLTGKQLNEKADALLEQWFDSFLDEYITEWNSNAYIPVDVLGLCSLYNLAEDGSKWKQAAVKGLDRIFSGLAVYAHKGGIMATFGRSYEKELKGNFTAGTTSLLYIAYNSGYLNRASLAYTSFVLGDYAPPREYEKYLEIESGNRLVFSNTQGYEQHVNLYMYKDFRTQLSTAIDFHPFAPGYQEHIMQANIDLTAQVFVNHPGEAQPYGNGRPNFWAGNGILPRGVQYENMGVLLFDIPQNHRIGYTHAYVPLCEFERHLKSGNCIALCKDGGYIGMKSLHEFTIQTVGSYKNREFICHARQNVWVMKVSTVEESGSLEDFFAAMEQVSIEYQTANQVKVWDGTLGELFVNEKDFLVNGQKIYAYPLHHEGVLLVGAVSL